MKPQKLSKTIKTNGFPNFSGVVDLVHVLGQVQQLAGIAVLVIIPGDQLDEGIRQGDK